MNNIEAMNKGRSTVTRRTIDGVMDLLKTSFTKNFGDNLKLNGLIEDSKNSTGFFYLSESRKSSRLLLRSHCPLPPVSAK
jgi:hypothetical protein